MGAELSMKEDMLRRVLACIEAEPELPGEPPPEMRLALQSAIVNGDVDLLAEVFRVTVQLTKRGISDRVKLAFAEMEKD